MQRVLGMLRGDAPPAPAGDAWCLGRRFECAGTWPEPFLDAVGSVVRLMYRTNFAPIARHPDGPSPALQNVGAFVRALPSAGLDAARQLAVVDVANFRTDVGWGCMIRTSQSVLANALLRLCAPPTPEDELAVLAQFADVPEARYSIHAFVAHGKQCGVLPGQWFGPSTAAACIAQFADVPVYRSDGADVYEQDLLDLLAQGPVLVLCNLRLGIDAVNPVYYAGVRSLLMQPQTVGIAGGRTSASLYFFGCTDDALLYHDPHEPRPAFSPSTDADALRASVHSRQLRALPLAELDPSMLAAFLVPDLDGFRAWKDGLATVEPAARVLQFLPARQRDRPLPDSEEREGYILCDAPSD